MYPWRRPRTTLEHFDGPDEWQKQFLIRLGEHVKARKFDGHTAVEPIRMAVSSGHGIGEEHDRGLAGQLDHGDPAGRAGDHYREHVFAAPDEDLGCGEQLDEVWAIDVLWKPRTAGSGSLDVEHARVDRHSDDRVDAGRVEPIDLRPGRDATCRAGRPRLRFTGASVRRWTFTTGC